MAARTRTMQCIALDVHKRHVADPRYSNDLRVVRESRLLQVGPGLLRHRGRFSGDTPASRHLHGSSSRVTDPMSAGCDHRERWVCPSGGFAPPMRPVVAHAYPSHSLVGLAVLSAQSPGSRRQQVQRRLIPHSQALPVSFSPPARGAATLLPPSTGVMESQDHPPLPSPRTRP